MMYLYSWNEYSESAKELAQAMGIKRIKHTNSKFVGNENKVVINWGSSSLPEEVSKCTIINHPDAVARVSNKKTFFEYMKQTHAVPYLVDSTTDVDVAKQWYDNGKTVVARTVLQGHSGDGIVLLNKEQNDFVQAPLYTLYKPKKDEYRIAMAKNANGVGELTILSKQRKARNLEVADDQVNWKIRNHANGFIYKRNDVQIPDAVWNAATQVFIETGLDFGALDIIYNERENNAYVLEVNTAPGLEGETVFEYALGIAGMINDMGH